MIGGLQNRGPRSALAGVFMLFVALAGCVTLDEQQIYVDWIVVANPATICNGEPDCVQHSMHRGKRMCTIVTADKNVSYSRLGEQVRDCIRTPPTEADHRRE
jgi:hypothetical protein